MYTRREFGWLALAGLVAETKVSALRTAESVRLGVQTYSFRDLPRTATGDMVDVIVKAMTACGFSECELYAPHIEPPTKEREALRQWRLKTPLTYFSGVKKTFDAAGIAIYAFNYSFNDTFSDQEIDRGFQIAKALGAEIITASTTVSVAKRVVPFAEQHRMVVAMHNHSRVDDPNEFATPDSFAAAMAMSKYFKVNLDIGHFTAGNNDPIAYLREHHAQITNLHLKDRKKNQGDNMPWGQGDTPIREVLQLLERERWPMRAYVEYEYKGTESPVDEVKRCFAYAKRALTESAAR